MLYKLLVFLCFITIGTSSFDCNNKGYLCLHGGICHYYGTCVCPKEFKGYNCGLETSTVSLRTECKVKCHNGGTCYNGDKCACTADFVGSLCEKQATGARCTFDAVVLEAYRPRGFDGETYLWQSRKLCKLLEVPTDVHGMKKYHRAISHTDTTECALTKTVNSPMAGDVTYEGKLVSAFNYNTFGMRDSIDHIKCIYKASKVGLQMDAADEKFPIKMTARSGANSNVQATTFKAPIDLLFTPQNIPDIKGVYVEFLEVYSINATSKDVVSKVLIDKGCVVDATQKELGITVSNRDELDTATSIWIGLVKIQAFILIDGEPLLFNYRLSFCPKQCGARTCAVV